ncbi:MAG: SLC13 family permease [Acidobacteria bacterium]|nr:SLC13 family permease [Acidobacteriota bacterium]
MSMMRSSFLYAINRKWLFIGLAVVFLFFLTDAPTGLGYEGWRAIGLALGSLIWFMKRPVRPVAIALLIIVLHVLLGISSNEEVAGSFFNESVFFIMGLLMIGTAMIKRGLDKTIGKLLFTISGGSIQRFLCCLVYSSALLSMIIGEYASSAIMLPFVLTVLGREENKLIRRVAAKPILFGIAFGCIIGGIGAPSGGARNVIMLQYLKEHHGYNMLYAEWIKYTLPLMILGIIIITILIYSSFTTRKIKSFILNADLFKHEWKKPLGPEDKTAIFILVITVILWLFFSNQLGMGIIAVFGASLYLVFGIVKWDDYNHNVNWGVIVLYSAVILLGNTLYNKGSADWIADNIFHYTNFGKILLYLFPALIAVIVPLISNIMGAIGAAAIFGPIALKLSVLYGISPVSTAILTAVASSFAFLNFKASPASLILYSTGYLQPTEFRRLGWKMLVISVILLIIISLNYWNLII